jgi:hypothetical protein
MEGKRAAQRFRLGRRQQHAIGRKIVKFKSHGHKVREKQTELFPAK